MSPPAEVPDTSGTAAGPTQAHYFRTPEGPQRSREWDVQLAGRDLRVQTADGVFSADRVDLGTRVLLRSVPPPPPEGTLLDLGCGWGPLALTLGLLAPRAQVWAVDVNERACALTADNARAAGLSSVRAAAPHQVPSDLRFDLIWSNPPIRVGKAELHAMLRHWLARLTPTGQAYLVVQRNLGADSLHSWLAEHLAADSEQVVQRLASAKGYRVLAVGPAPTAPSSPAPS